MTTLTQKWFKLGENIPADVVFYRSQESPGGIISTIERHIHDEGYLGLKLKYLIRFGKSLVHHIAIFKIHPFAATDPRQR